MLEIKQVNLGADPLAKLAEYNAFLIPNSLSKLKAEEIPSRYQLIALEAALDGKKAGFAVVKLYESNKSGEIASLLVSEPYRRKGVGTALFRELQSLLKAQGTPLVAFEYESTGPFAQAIEKILAILEWPKPYLYMLRCTFDIPTFNPPWLERHSKIPVGAKTFPWREVKPDEKKLILRQEDQGTFPAYLSPLRDVEHIDPINSLGMRYRKKLIGWMITHRLDADTLRYTSLYIDRDYLGSGLGIYLLIEALLRQKKSSVKKALFEVNLEHAESSWLHFIKRRLLPYAQQTTRINWASKAL